MINTIFIDSNNTLEDFESIRKNTYQIITNVSNKAKKDNIFININEANLYLKFLEDNISKNTAWINHPVFWRGIIGKENSRVVDKIYNLYLDEYEKYITLFDDVLESLNNFKSKSYKLFLLANGNQNRLYRLIQKYYLDKYFDDYLISGETYFKKPDEIMFLFFLKKENIAPDNIIMIGDKYKNDIAPANYQGITTCLIKRQQKTKIPKDYSSNPDFTIYNLKSISNIIHSINSNILLPQKKPIKVDNNFIDTAIILAGGKGTRLGNLGRTKNKAMLEIDNIPLLERIINNFKNIGVKTFIIAVSHLSEQIINHFGDGSDFLINIKYITNTFPSTSEALAECIKYVNNVFYYCHGNILFQNNLLIDMAKDFSFNQTSVVSCIKKTDTINHVKIIKGKNNLIQKISNQKINEITFLGLAIYKKDCLLSKLQPNAMVEEFIPYAIEEGKEIRYIMNDNYYGHIATEEDYNKINEFYKDNI